MYRQSQLGATKNKHYSLVLLSSEQIYDCRCSMPCLTPCSGAFEPWRMTEVRSLLYLFPTRFAEAAPFLSTGSFSPTLPTATCMTNTLCMPFDTIMLAMCGITFRRLFERLETDIQEVIFLSRNNLASHQSVLLQLVSGSS